MLTYSGILNHYGQTTLPSLESWYLNANIEKDPPKSVSTRRKTYVKDTQQVNEMIAEAPDRYCEAINYYARGVNPMVSVDFGLDNKLPYRVVRDGAFRPPIWRQEDLLPLSRMPRNFASVYASKEMIDWTSKAINAASKKNLKDALNIECKARDVIERDAETCTPLAKLMLKSPLEVNATANKSFYKPYAVSDYIDEDIELARTAPLIATYECGTTKDPRKKVEEEELMRQKEVTLRPKPSYQNASIYTNKINAGLLSNKARKELLENRNFSSKSMSRLNRRIDCGATMSGGKHIPPVINGVYTASLVPQTKGRITNF